MYNFSLIHLNKVPVNLLENFINKAMWRCRWTEGKTQEKLVNATSFLVEDIYRTGILPKIVRLTFLFNLIIIIFTLMGEKLKYD